MAGMPAPTPAAERLVVVSPTSNRIGALVFLVAIPTLLMGMFLYAALRGPIDTGAAIIVGLFGISWALLVMLAAFLMSARAELTKFDVRRTTIFGVKKLALAEVTSALLLYSSRGGVSLTVRTADDWILFSNSSFSNAQLREMQQFIAARAAEIGHEIQTARPMPGARQAQLVIALYLGILVAVIALVGISGMTHQWKLQQTHRAS